MLWRCFHYHDLKGKRSRHRFVCFRIKLLKFNHRGRYKAYYKVDRNNCIFEKYTFRCFWVSVDFNVMRVLLCFGTHSDFSFSFLSSEHLPFTVSKFPSAILEEASSGWKFIGRLCDFRTQYSLFIWCSGIVPFKFCNQLVVTMSYDSQHFID